VWNLAVEQQLHWHPGKKSAPGHVEQCRQLTEARAEHEWLHQGSVTVQQQALRDFAYAMANFFARTHRRPTWRKMGRDEGFRIVAIKPGHVRRVSRKVGEAWIPKAGWVRFRWSRAVPDGVKSYRVTLDRAGRWHIAFAAIPEPIPPPHTGSVVGVDRGIAVSAALSTGAMLVVPRLSRARQRRLRLLERKLARAESGSNRRNRIRHSLARLRTRDADARKDRAATYARKQVSTEASSHRLVS
jgi:transposase